MTRREEFAIDYKNGLFWIAYRYSGGEKEESVFVEGWNMDGKKGGELYSTFRRILEVQFGRNSDGDALDLMSAPFLSCDQAYIGPGVPLSIRAVLEEFFATNEIAYSEVRCRPLHKRVLNERWSEALGEPLKNTKEDAGYVLALTVLTKGVRSNASLAS